MSDVNLREWPLFRKGALGFHSFIGSIIPKMELIMSDIDLKEWTEFRKEALQLQSNIGVMVPKMDRVMGDKSLPDAEREHRMDALLTKYLPGS